MSVISIHVGQAGVQMGECCWQLYCLEHGIQPDGIMPAEKMEKDSMNKISNFFTETETGKYVPRSLMVDSEPTVVNQVRTGPNRNLFDNDSLITGNEDAAENYGRGRITVGHKYIENVVNQLKKQAENCDAVQGVLLFHAVGGGTGSGFASLLLQRVCDDFLNKTILQFAIYPSTQMSTSVVEPYNALLATHYNIDKADCTFVLDNEALLRLCRKTMNVPLTFRNLNQVVSQAVSSVTASQRYSGDLNVSLTELATNLVPFQRIHFAGISYAPINAPQEHSIWDITKKCFRTSNQMVTWEPRTGKNLGLCMLYRGDIMLEDVNRTIATIRSRNVVRFAEWTPTGIKVGINRLSPTVVHNSDMAEVKRAVCTLSNSTAITKVWNELLRKFDLMYKKRAFVHWFIREGVEEGEFGEAQLNLEDIVGEYTSTVEEYSVADTSEGEDD